MRGAWRDPPAIAPLDTALRDLIWRIDHVRSLVEQTAADADFEAVAKELIALLDTSDAHAALETIGTKTVRDDSQGN